MIHFLPIENRLKAYIAYEFSRVNGADGYLDANNFNYIPINQQEINTLISKIQSLIEKKSKSDNRLQHYNNNHKGNIPLWVIINLLTFGNVSMFYKYMNRVEQNRVAKRFNMNPKILDNYLKNITLARNICAHSERLFSLKFKAGIGPLPEHNILKIPLKNKTFTMGIHDLLSILLILKYLLNNQGAFQNLIENIESSITKLSKELKCVTIGEVLVRMGLPNNWNKLK